MASMSTRKSQHVLLNDHIIKMTVNEGEVVDADDIREMHTIHLKLTGGNPFVILLDAKKHFTVTPEARELLASEEFLKHHLASAFLVRTVVVKLTGNFFIRFNQPKNPTELFSNEEKAMVWLEAFWTKKKKG